MQTHFILWPAKMDFKQHKKNKSIWINTPTHTHTHLFITSANGTWREKKWSHWSDESENEGSLFWVGNFSFKISTTTMPKTAGKTWKKGYHSFFFLVNKKGKNSLVELHDFGTTVVETRKYPLVFFFPQPPPPF